MTSSVSRPSNTQALQDALDKIDSRMKYRTKTFSPSDGDQIRWYFSKDPLPLQDYAASRPTTEVVAKGDFLRFSVNDSLTLEAAFLKQEEELVSTWWEEYAECSEGPLGSQTKDQQASATDEGVTFLMHSHLGPKNGQRSADGLFEDDGVIGVPVKGGLYEVDLLRRRCYPIYWTGNHRRVLRGHWFAQKGGLDWLPLREDVSEQLEFAYRSRIWHRRTFQPSGKFAARVNLQSSIEGLHALFTGEDDTWEAWLYMDVSGISSMLGFKGVGVKLRRGFAPSESPQPTQDELQQRKEEQMDDYCSQVPVRHLVFMVHGIGQRLENANLVDDVGNFRRITTYLAEQHLTTYQRNRQRVLFIPCQWRRGLRLAGEEAVENCTLEGVRALRTMLSATVHDVLYYMSPVYCQDIIDSVCGQLNKLYQKFMKRNPGYDGKVSLYGHSLGSVLAYDILCHQNKLISASPISQINGNIQNEKMDESVKLDQLTHPTEETSSNTLDSLRVQMGEMKEKLAQIEGVHISREEAIPDDQSSGNREVSDCIEREKSFSEAEGTQESIQFSEETRDRNQEMMQEDQGHRLVTAINQKEALKTKYGSRKSYTPYIEYTKLAFEVDTFFAVGSPLGVFLSLRNVRIGVGKGNDYWEDDYIDEEIPACNRMFNVFHPFDPVAFRIEPLVCKEYMHMQPEFVPYHRGGRRLHIGMQEFGKDFSARSKALVHSLTVVGDRVIKAFSTSTNEGKEEKVDLPKVKTYGSLMIEKLTGELNGRIDFMLQDATFEHPYLQAISSHTAYWQDLDTALFILKHLYRDIPAESPNYEGESVVESIDESITPGQSPFVDDSYVIDDDLAFTFSRRQNVIAGKLSENKKLKHVKS